MTRLAGRIAKEAKSPFMFFVYFALIFTSYLFLSVVWPLPAGKLAKALITILILLSIGRIAIMREIFGGLGGIECDRRLLIVTSFLQDTVIFLFMLAVLRDAAYVLSLVSHASASLEGWGLGFRKAIKGVNMTVALAAAAALLSGYALYEAAKVPRVDRVEAEIPGLPPALDGLKVALLADLHISRFFDRPWVEEVVKVTNSLDPDLILIPGDLVDGEVSLRAVDVAPLAELKAPYGKFYCVGNHEYISDLPKWLPAFQALGLTNLYNQNAALDVRGSTLYLVGVTDQAAYGRNLPGPDLRAALKGVPSGASPVILLEHRPHNAAGNAKDGRVTLQISGHTHGGLFPGLKSLTKRSNQGYLSGWYEVDGMRLYVHRGSGLWAGVPARILDPSEITLLTLRVPSDERTHQDAAPPQAGPVGGPTAGDDAA
ncbi:MAG: metallophosphoesterase [Deltaproteobacteria bacterium]|jgi:predicted MPP superfamily phosphohydrolase|nr:metallophosphoesterase [Deltaproteobacteria bacterium]